MPRTWRNVAARVRRWRWGVLLALAGGSALGLGIELSLYAASRKVPPPVPDA